MVFYELDRTKQILEITDTADDALLNNLGLGAAETFKNWLLMKMDELPFGDDITPDMKNIVSYKTAARYCLAKKDYEGAKLWNSEYDVALEGIRTGIDERQEDEFVIAEKR